MPTSRRFRSRRGGSARIKTTWNNSALTFTLGTAGVVTFANLTPRPLSIGDESHGTAVCKRAIMNFKAVQLESASNVPQNFGIGLYVSTRQAISQLEILLPLGAGNTNQDWYYWTGRSTYGETNEVGQSSPDWDVDIRTSRRLREGYGLVLAIEPASANTSGIIITASVRLLWSVSN